MINLAVVEMFIDYLSSTGHWEMEDSNTSNKEDYLPLPTAATIVNLQDGISALSAVIVALLAYIADYYLKCFITIVIFALAYTMVIPRSFLV